VQRLEVKGVVIAGFGRIFAAPIPLCPGEQEVINRGADDFAAPAPRRTKASSSDRVVLPAAGDPSTATASGARS
jgi:hypothetical protein